MRLVNYRKTALAALVMMAASAFAPSGNTALLNYRQDFEGLDRTDPDALGNDGWLVSAGISAPNNGAGFSTITTGQGGPTQGAQQLTVFSDYGNTDHTNGTRVEAVVYQQQTISAADVGTTWSFAFDARQGDQIPDSSSLAFLRTLDPGNNFALTNFLTIDTTALGFNWSTYSLDILIDPHLSDQLLQFGFSSTAANYTPSGVLYDNIHFSTPTVPLPAAAWLMISGLLAVAGLARRKS